MREDSDCNSPLRHIGARKYNFENENMCISIKDLFENMMEKIPNECYVMGVYAGEGEGDNKKNDEKNFNSISNSAAIYKLSLQKIFRLDDKKLFYYPYFSRCCEDRFFNTIALKHCYRLNLYKLRFGHFKKEGNHNDVLTETEKYHYNNGYQGAKTYYNHILKYIIDLKKLLKNNFNFNEDNFNISINNREALGIESAIYKDSIYPSQKQKYGKYQIVLFVLYLLFKDGYENAKENLNNYVKSYHHSTIPLVLNVLFKYCLYLFRKYKNNINDSKFINKFANDMEKHLEKSDEFNVMI